MILRMALVISDSSTLMHLARIGQIELLRDLYGSLTIPPSVWREVVSEGKGRPGVNEVVAAHQAGWLQVDKIADESHLRLLSRELDDGEAEVLALAIERSADLVLLDETEARRIADLYRIAKTGVIGILIRAKAEGKVAALRPLLDALRESGGFWVADGLYSQALRAVGEV
jgi:predicted nucleic acid-binding protein